MSGPNGGAEPPAILITWSSAAGAWTATAVMAVEVIDVGGPSTSEGETPAQALDALLTRRFAALRCEDCAPTLVSIDVIEEER